MKYSATISLLALSSASALSSVAPSTTKNPNAAVTVMANGMSLLKPAFAAEAKLQAAALGGKIEESEIMAEINAEVKANKILIYTYGLSPFSTEAVSVLESSGYDFTKIELGAEWFLLGGKESVKRVALSNYVENQATSLPKIFIGGKCIGGYAELASLVESGEFEALVKKAGVRKPVAAGEKKGLFGLF